MLRYQKVQQLKSVVNAVLGLVLISESIATNMMAGGATILNDYHISGLVKSLMGVGKERTDWRILEQ